MQQRIIDFLLEQWQTHSGRTERVHIAQAPGRVNLIGDHTDYNDGFVLPMTVDRALFAIARSRQDEQVHVRSLNFEEDLEFLLSATPDAPPGWKGYVIGVTEELRHHGVVSTGFDMMLHGDIPVGAGLSSSAALTTATALALGSVFKVDFDPIELVRLCQHVEHRYAGVQCGIMDQFASRMGRAGHALFLDCRSLDSEPVAFPLDGHRLVMIHSGVNRALAASAYNERRSECERAVTHFQQFDPAVRALRDLSWELFEREKSALSTTIQKRCIHVLSENARVLGAVSALKKGQLAAFGRLMNSSHESLRDYYEVSSPELDALVETAWQVPGVLGSRMTGAGFGGCTVSLVEQEAVPALTQRIEEEYTRRFERKPAFYVMQENLETEVLSL